VITSGRPQERVSDGWGENSPFAAAFLLALRDTGRRVLTASALYTAIQQHFDENTVTQLPQFGHPRRDSIGGDFLFFVQPP
jgi:hypothetical protein